MTGGLLQALNDHLLAAGVATHLLGILVIFSAIVAVAQVAYHRLTTHDDVSRLPIINERKPWALFATSQKLKFIQDARSLIQQGLDATRGAFQLQTDDGIQLVLSGDFADQIKDHPDLSLTELTANDFQAGIPGFDAFTQAAANDQIFLKTIETLTRQIPSIAGALSNEATNALQTLWTDQTEWHETPLFNTIFTITLQISSRAFLGPELCRNQEWAKHSKAYGDISIVASQDLRLWPRWSRPYVHWLLPSCRLIRREMAICRRIITTAIEARRREEENNARLGLKPEKYKDAMEWLNQIADGRPHDAAATQLILSITATFTSANALTQVLYDLCDQPQLVDDMRKEIISVMAHGHCDDPNKQWSKSNMYRLKLMDSVMKESQRIRPPAITSMHRVATRDTVLPNGLRMPKGRKLMVSAHESWDDSVFPDAESFDGYRFVRLRDQGQKMAQRFFAANEIKVALCHILLKYDLKFATEKRPEMTRIALLHLSDTVNNIQIRRRREEIQLL